MPMTPETLKEIEDDYARWCNDPENCPGTLSADCIACRIMDHLPDLIAAVKERNAFAANMDYSVRLGVAMATEQLQKDRDAALKACAEMRQAAADFVWNVEHSHVAGFGDLRRDVIVDESFKVLSKTIKSADLSKGYHHERDIEPLVQICRDIRNRMNQHEWGECGAYSISRARLYKADLIALNEALAHWEKVRGK